MQLFQPFEEFIPLLTFFLAPMGLLFSAGSFLSGRKHAVTFYLLTHFLCFHIPVATVLSLLFSSKELHHLARCLPPPTLFPLSPHITDAACWGDGDLRPVVI